MNKDNEKLLWIGSFQSEEDFRNMPIPNMGQASAFASQKGIISGIDSNLSNNIIMDSINAVPYPPYPLYPHISVEKKEWSRNHYSKDVSVGYKNKKFLRFFYREKALFKEVKRWGNNNVNCRAVFVYAPSVAKLKSALYLKKRFGSSVFVIIPDIPERISMNAPKIVRFAKRIAAIILKKQFLSVDGFVLYSSDMASYYKLKSNKWMLMEGVFDENEFKNFPKPNVDDYIFENKKIIKLTYCGVMNDFRATPSLLNFFSKLDPTRFELHLFGIGDSVPLIEQYSKNNPNIIYHGFVSNREIVLREELSSDILLHIRQTDPPEKMGFCFPSKIFEYLATGKPVVSVRIPSIPNEYFNYLFEIKHMTCEGFLNAINQVLDMSPNDLFSRCIDSQNFIRNNKTSVHQGKRILIFAGLLENK